MKSKQTIAAAFFAVGVLSIYAAIRFADACSAAPRMSVLEYVLGLPAFVFCLAGLTLIVGSATCFVFVSFEEPGGATRDNHIIDPTG